MKLRFTAKSSQINKTLDRILDQISDELNLEKRTVNSCLDSSLYHIKHSIIRNFQHLNDEDQVFFVDSLIHCFESNLTKEIDSHHQINNIKALIQSAATIAIDLP